MDIQYREVIEVGDSAMALSRAKYTGGRTTRLWLPLTTAARLLSIAVNYRNSSTRVQRFRSTVSARCISAMALVAARPRWQ